MPSRRVTSFDGRSLPPEIAALVPVPVQERWRGADRAMRAPELVMVLDDDSCTGVALVSARRGGAYLKIVDAVGDVPGTLSAIVALAEERGLAQVKWEGWTVDPADAAALGFTPMAVPLASAIDDAEPESGYVRWLVDAEVAEPRYYRQTESFTCGAVVTLMAQERAGLVEASDITRSAELALWRSATNFPACEPVGLGVAVRRAWPDAKVTVALDATGPVMLDHLPEAEQGWRAVLQETARADAAGLGMPVDERRVSVEALRASIRAGEGVLVVISLEIMQGFAVPHWVLCHEAVDGALVVEDPWTSANTGDTWVDAHLLPVADSEFDAMAALGPDGYRGAIRIS